MKIGSPFVATIDHANQLSAGKLRTFLWVLPLLTATLFSKLAVPPFGVQGIGITLPLLLMATFLGVFFGELQIAPSRFVWASLCLACLGLLQTFKTDVFSVNSLLLLAALHLPFIWQFRRPLPDGKTLSNFFIVMCCVIACLAIVQLALQGHVDSSWLFPFENFIPRSFTLQNFNEQAPLEYGSEVFRANGVVMIEPSYLSQLLAVGVVLEMATRTRWWVLLILALGMLVSYSGTGFIVLAVSIPVLVIAQRRWNLVAILLGGLVITLILAQTMSESLHLDKLLARSGEFNATGSSGFARFVGGFYLFDQFLWDQPAHALFGVGAGMFKEYAPLANYPVSEMPLFKMVMEFGILGALLYFVFLARCMASSAMPGAVAIAIGLTFLLNGLYVPFSHALALSLLLWTDTTPAPVMHDARLASAASGKAAAQAAADNSTSLFPALRESL